nr:PAS domain-containing protein [uncultured Pedobacter sp.]
MRTNATHSELSSTESNTIFGASPFAVELFDRLPVAVYTCDPSGFITSYNQAAALLWGRKPELNKDLWCGSWKVFYTNGERMALDSSPMAVALSEGSHAGGIEITLERPDGSRKNVIEHPVLLFDDRGQLCGAVNTVIDIAEQRDTEIQLLKLLGQVKELSINENEFTRLASQEFRTTLASVSQYLELILQSVRPDDANSTLLIRAQKQLMALHKLVGRLIETGKNAKLLTYLFFSGLPESLVIL